MSALKERVSSDLDNMVNRTDSPFTTSINSSFAAEVSNAVGGEL